jgi:hypothetical protein
MCMRWVLLLEQETIVSVNSIIIIIILHLPLCCIDYKIATIYHQYK